MFFSGASSTGFFLFLFPFSALKPTKKKRYVQQPQLNTAFQSKTKKHVQEEKTKNYNITALKRKGFAFRLATRIYLDSQQFHLSWSSIEDNTKSFTKDTFTLRQKLNSEVQQRPTNILH